MSERGKSAGTAGGAERRTIVADGLGMPAFPPQIVNVTQELGTHIMGAVVVAWIGGLALERWGEQWLRGGSMSFRFRRHLEEGVVLRVAVEEGDELDVELIGDDDGVFADARMRLGPPATLRVGDPREIALVRTAFGVDELSVGTRFGSIEIDFDARRDQGFLNALSRPDPFQALGIAHPGWLLSAVNAIIRRAVALPRTNSAQAGTTITSFAPIGSGATLLLDGQVLELFESKGRHYVVTSATVRAGEVVAAVVEVTSCYW
jgi:acyl-coenzyme A thioesterase PaaI-like protein